MYFIYIYILYIVLYIIYVCNYIYLHIYMLYIVICYRLIYVYSLLEKKKVRKQDFEKEGFKIDLCNTFN